MENLLYGFTMNKSVQVFGNPKQERYVYLHLPRAGSQSQRKIFFTLPALAASHIINNNNLPHGHEDNY